MRNIIDSVEFEFTILAIDGNLFTILVVVSTNLFPRSQPLATVFADMMGQLVRIVLVVVN